MIREKQLSTIPGLVALPVLLGLLCFSGYTMVRAFAANDAWFGFGWAFVAVVCVICLGGFSSSTPTRDGCCCSSATTSDHSQ